MTQARLRWIPATEVFWIAPVRLSRAWFLRLTVLLLSIGRVSAEAQTNSPSGNDRTSQALGQYRSATLESKGDASRGLRLFQDVARTRCAACHLIGGRGLSLGPDLSGLGAGRSSRAEILDAILEPSSKIHPDYTSAVVALKSGRIVQGLVRPVSDSELDVVISATETIRVARADVEEQSPSRISLMPAGLHEAMTPGEMADLISYLVALEPPGSGSLREAMNPREIAQVKESVRFVPFLDPDQTFHRPVWFGPLTGYSGISAVIEMQGGRIWLLEKEGRKRSLFVDLSGETTTGELTGLTSVAFHPDFAQNGRYFFKMHTARAGGRLAVQILERKAAPGGLRDSGEASKLVLKIPVVSEIHNGGHLAFGPDGFLYIGMGDTGPQGDPRGNGQDLSTLLGKISRIDVDHAEGGRPYAIPVGNPYRDQAGALPEIWAIGFREPWRFAFDPPTGDLWVGDVGQGLYEEVSIVRAGENYGWNVIEGFRPFSDRFAKPDARYVPPVFAYHHRVGVSVTGGFVYRGRKNPALVGKYIFGDFETRRVWALDQKDRAVTSLVEIGRAPERIASFGLDSEGELHVVGLDRGQIYQIDATSANLEAIPPTFAVEAIPTSRREPATWKRTEMRPPAEWSREDFDDSTWSEAPGGFGTRETPNAVVRTEWRSSDIWLRRIITLPEVDPKTLSLLVHHDEDAEIYLNGVLAARLRGFKPDYDEFPISDEARAALRAGQNTLAVHCHQTGGGQYIDVGILQQTPGPRPPR